MMYNTKKCRNVLWGFKTLTQYLVLSDEGEAILHLI